MDRIDDTPDGRPRYGQPQSGQAPVVNGAMPPGNARDDPPRYDGPPPPGDPKLGTSPSYHPTHRHDFPQDFQGLPEPNEPSFRPGPAAGPLPPGPENESQIAGPAAHITGNITAHSADPPSIPRPAPVLSPLVTTNSSRDIRSLKTSTQFALREYLTLQRKRMPFDGSTTSLDLEERIRVQAGLLVGDLRVLREEVGRVIKAAEKHRWRKWLFGGVL
jgi:hypothetical protein